MGAPSSDQAAIRQIIRALKAAGHDLVNVDDGEEHVKVKTETEAIEAIMAVDQAHLFVTTPEGPNAVGYVFFVLGNDPEEVACDYTLSLSAVLDPLTESWWD